MRLSVADVAIALVVAATLAFLIYAGRSPRIGADTPGPPVAVPHPLTRPPPTRPAIGPDGSGDQ